MAAVMPWVAKVLATKIFASITVGTIVKAVAAYTISKMLTKKASGANSGTTLQLTQQADAYRRIIYGTNRVSGNIFFVHATGKKNKYLHLVIALAGHEVSSIGQTYVEDVAAGLDSSGNGIGDFSGKLRVHKWLGNQTTADATLVSETAGKWSSSCIAKGIAATYCLLTYDTNVYATGLPNLTWIVDGRKVYDPRTETTAFSRNPALCILDYLRNTDFGLAATDDEIDFASFIAAANICDETVALAGGGSEPRYRMDAVFTTDSEPASVIETMLATMGGSLVYSGGKFRLQAGAYYPATEPAIDESDLCGAIEYQTAAPLSEMCNTVKGTFTSPSALYQQKDYPVVNDDALIASDGGEISRDYSLSLVQSAAQAQRLAKAELRQSRLGGILTLRLNLVGLRYRAGDTILVNNTRYGWDEKVFRIIEWKFAVESDGSMGVDVTCKEHSASIWDWTAASDEKDSSGGNDDVDIPVSGDTSTGEPGTYDDLNGTTGGGTPEGSIAVQSRGGTWSLCGINEYEPSDGSGVSAPPKRFLRETWSGSGGCSNQSYHYCTIAGARTIDAATCVETDATTINGAPPGFGPDGDPYCLSHLSDLCSGVVITETRTRTVRTRTYVRALECEYCGTIDATWVRTLSNPDTPDAAIARLMATSPDWADGQTAIRTVPTTGITGVYREARYRTEHTAGDPAVTTPTLTGLVPWQRYQLTVTLESRPVDSAGAPTGDGSWSAAGTRQHYILANLDGEGGIDWQVVEPTAGYETRIASTLVEAA